jgi:diadenosine tetraphosphate (Ap4A) HIT family hydrolase
MKAVTDPACIFCKIVSGAIPSFKVFENEHVLAFLDINALSPGHTLVIPKYHAERTHQLPADVMGEVGRAIHVVSSALVATGGMRDYNVLQNNGAAAHQAVMHVHYHVIPKTDNEGLDIIWNSTTPDKGELGELANKLSSHIKSKI